MRDSSRVASSPEEESTGARARVCVCEFSCVSRKKAFAWAKEARVLRQLLTTHTCRHTHTQNENTIRLCQYAAAQQQPHLVSCKVLPRLEWWDDQLCDNPSLHVKAQKRKQIHGL